MDLAFFREQIAQQSFAPLFATVSGAHLYGFESPDSDVDLRGAFVLPLSEVVGLRTGAETVTLTYDRANLEIDLVCHDVLKYCRLLLKHSGEVLEQLYSPLVVWDAPELHELRELARPQICRPCYFHYRGFLGNQLRLLKRPEATLKETLYAYRVALTGIHLMRTGVVEGHLPTLLDSYPQSGVADLIAAKTAGQEFGGIDPELLTLHRSRLNELERELADAYEASSLPSEGAPTDALHDFVLRIRLRA